MEELKKYLEEFLSERLYRIIVSNPKYQEGAFKVKVRPVMVKDRLEFQQTVYKGAQVFHSNYPGDEMLVELLGQLGFEAEKTETVAADKHSDNAARGQVFRQLEAESMDGRLAVKLSR